MARAEIPNKLGFLFEPHRYKVLRGGRGGTKSWSCARALLTMAADEKWAPLRILCTREFQLSIRDSVHKILTDQIALLNLGGMYDVTQQSIRSKIGSEFIFTGLWNNVAKIKSMEGVDICWCEEAEAISEESWSILVPTIRKKGSEIWVSFNPNLETDATYQRFVVSPPPGAVVVEIGWEENPWISDELLAEKDHLYAVDADAAAWVWGGKTRTINKALVLFGKVVVEPFTPGEDWDGPYQGVDWGFAESPTALVRLWIYGPDNSPTKTLYVEYEAYGVGVEVTDTPALFDTVPKAADYVTRADNARPEMISHCRNNDYPKMIACVKGKGSVEDGVAHLRGYTRIVIHPRCEHAIEESRLWSYKKNKAGDVLPILVDAHDHIWDAARYALEPVMRQDEVDYEVIVI
jgi:phage terminase large subunit